MEHVTSDKLRAALLHAIETMAPIGSDREIPFNIYCDCMVSLLADFLVAAPQPEAPDELVERLVATFRDKLTAAMARRGVAGHA
jgi:hypothetical protein